MKSQALTEAIAYLVRQQPFFSVYLFDMMSIVETDSIPTDSGMAAPNPTAATDGKHIWINPDWFGKLPIKERVFVLAHEILHGIYQHMSRGKRYVDLGFGPDMKPWSHKRYKKAADYVINATLQESGVGTAPKGALLDASVTSADLVDDVYCGLGDDSDDQQQGQGQGDQGGGHDKHITPSNPDKMPTEAEIQRAVAGAASAAKAMGKMPGVLKRLIGELIEPQVDWRERLQTLMTASSGHDTATWARPNRRRLALGGMYFPGTTGVQIGGVALVIDTSGSISDKELNAFMSECSGILSECKPEWVKVLWTDTQVAHVDDVDDVEQLASLEAKGGGGTNLVAAFDYMEAEGIEPEQCVVFTDMYTPFGEDPGYPVTWASTTESREAPYGETVYVKV